LSHTTALRLSWPFLPILTFEPHFRPSLPLYLLTDDMRRSHPKAQGRGVAHPKHDNFIDSEDNRSYRGSHTDDYMDVDFQGVRREQSREKGRDDRRDDRKDDRRKDGPDERRVEYRDDRRDDRKDDRRKDGRDERRAEYREDPRDDDRLDSRGDPKGDRPGFRRDDPKDNLVTAFFPTTDIAWEVIESDIQQYLGPEALVEKGYHPRVRNPLSAFEHSMLIMYRIIAFQSTMSQLKVFLLQYVNGRLPQEGYTLLRTDFISPCLPT
jgi:hypothetical protein